jgi:hypothetical protein
MPDDIYAEISYGDSGSVPDFVAFRIFQGDRRISSTTLRREIAVELHRRINRIPEAAPEPGPFCVVCHAIAEDAPPGLYHDGEGRWLCVSRVECIERSMKDDPEPEPLHDGGLPCGPNYHCHGKLHCSCDKCHDGGPNSRLPDLRPDEPCQVVMTPSMYRAYEKWLDSNGMYAFGIPVSDDDLPTYGIGSKDGF